MWGWLKFIAMPLIVSLIVGVVFSVLAGIFRWDVGSWANVLGDFIASFLMGMAMYHLAPRGKMLVSVIYAGLFFAQTAYTSYSMAGTTGEVFGNTVYYEFHLSRQIATALGLILGIWLSRPEPKTANEAG